jgi:putative ABC transport system permease protein
MMDTLWQDLRYGARMLWKNPGFTFVAIITLALGIGANTAIFSVVNTVLLHPLPFEEPQRLVLLNGTPAPHKGESMPVGALVREWREQTRSFESLAAYGLISTGANLTGGSEPIRVAVTETTANFFSTMGIKAVAGRTFLPEEEQAGRGQVAVLSYDLWQRQFGGGPKVIGRTLVLNGKSLTVIGVAPPRVRYPGKAEMWVPIALGAERVLSKSVLGFQVIGRLKTGVTLDEARAEMKVFSEWLKQQFPEHADHDAERQGVQLIPLADELVRGIRPALLILLGAVAFVLLIACANVSNLLLVRAATRQKEVAIRSALGANRVRLIRQFLAEGLLLAVGGGLLSWLLAMWGIDLLVALGSEEIPRSGEISLDGRVFGFTLIVSVLTGILCGLAPALQASRVDLSEALKEGASRIKVGIGARGLRSLLVIAEVALALVLMIGAGLLIKSFLLVREVHPGFNPENVVTLALELPEAQYPQAAQKTAFYQQLIERVSRLPGVEAVGAINHLPMSQGAIIGFSFTLEGRPRSKESADVFAFYMAISPGYFRAMGIPLLQGRPLTEQDTKSAAPVVVINHAMARRFWPDGNPIGQRVKFEAEKVPREIVGVVGSVKHFGLELQGEFDVEAYVPYLQAELMTPSALAVRATTDRHNLISAIRSEINALDRELPIYDLKTMNERLADSIASRRFTLLLLSIFAGLALALATIGIYGLMSYTVTQQTRELGIRLALGAQTRDVFKLILRRGILLTLIGLGIGLGGAFGLTRLLESMVFAMTVTDPVTFAGVTVLLGAVAVLACYLPARRATRVDPLVTLRYE